MNAKPSVFYPAVISMAVLGVVGLVLLWLNFTVTIEPTPPETLSLPPTDTLQQQSSPGTSATISTVATPIPKPTKSVKQKTSQASSNQAPTEVAANQGVLRVINQTEQPLRVALLAQQAVAATGSRKVTYGEEPVHWDFAPGEGSNQGLVLSLPQGNLKLKKGDILVAFAQDGSRRYWGPYVVGETAAPTWNQQKAEWQLILQP